MRLAERLVQVPLRDGAALDAAECLKYIIEGLAENVLAGQSLPGDRHGRSPLLIVCTAGKALWRQLLDLKARS